MNTYIDRLPKQYRESVRDFYKDNDGWWICLNSNGLYEFVGYESQYTIHEDTQLEAIRQFRNCIQRKNEERLYLAYGSNLNLAQMKYRCPGSKLVGYAYVEDYRLIFRGSGSGNYLSIEPAPGRMVPCGVFSITANDEKNLDHYPNWNADLPMPLYTFFEEYDFSGKTIIPFVTHGGSGFSSTIRTIQRLEPDATVIEAGLSISRNSVPNAQADVKSWTDSLLAD